MNRLRDSQLWRSNFFTEFVEFRTPSLITVLGQLNYWIIMKRNMLSRRTWVIEKGCCDTAVRIQTSFYNFFMGLFHHFLLHFSSTVWSRSPSVQNSRSNCIANQCFMTCFMNALLLTLILHTIFSESKLVYIGSNRNRRKSGVLKNVSMETCMTEMGSSMAAPTARSGEIRSYRHRICRQIWKWGTSMKWFTSL